MQIAIDQTFWQRASATEQQWAERFTRNGRLSLFAYEVVRFGVKKAWACLFPFLMLMLMAGTFALYVACAINCAAWSTPRSSDEAP